MSSWTDLDWIRSGCMAVTAAMAVTPSQLDIILGTIGKRLLRPALSVCEEDHAEDEEQRPKRRRVH